MTAPRLTGPCAPIDWPLRRRELGDAEKDLAFALVKLQAGETAAAFLNTAVALGRVSRHMGQHDWQVVDLCLRELGLGGIHD
jgi:hypothetical protein